MYPEPDIVLHIGLAAGRNYFTLEQGAHGRGYDKFPDVDGKRFPDKLAEEHFPSSKFPHVLKTSFDTSDVLARWRKNLGYSSVVDGGVEDKVLPDVRLNPDAGNFLCGFIYYNSLAHYSATKEDERPVAFMHVPDLSYSKEKTVEGWEVAITLIKALVESRGSQGVVLDGHNGYSEEEERRAAPTDNNFV
jgi:pyroglutamyl-peptidase